MLQYQLDARGHRGSQAVERLVEYAPATGGLALWMQHRDVDQAPARAQWAVGKSDARWIIGNNGTTLFYGPAFPERSLAEQTGLVAHQVLHVALRHVAREQVLQARLGSIESELFAVCADAIVNSSLSHLNWLTLPKGSVMLDTVISRVLGIEQAVDVSLQQWDCETLYRAIDDRGGRAKSESQEQRSKQLSRDGQSDQQATSTNPASQREPQQAKASESSQSSGGVTSSSQTASDPRLDGPKAAAARQLAATINRDLIPDADAQPELQQEQALQWRERLTRAHVADEGQSLLRQLLADNNSTTTPWEQLLRTRLQRALAQQPDLNWSRPTRSWLANQGRTSTGHRMPWQPGTSYSRSSPRLCVMVDVSGSVDDTVLRRFASEIDRILRTLRTDVYLIVGDDQVRSQCRLSPGVQALREIRFDGGGGTDFIPLIQAADKLQPDLGVFLTDLEGPAGESPQWPLLWAVPEASASLSVPFGTRLLLD